MELTSILILIVCEAIVIVPASLVATKVGFLWNKECNSLSIRRCIGAIYVGITAILVGAFGIYSISNDSWILPLFVVMLATITLALEVLNIWYEMLKPKQQITVHNRYFKTMVAFGKKHHLKRFTKWHQFCAGTAISMNYHGREYEYTRKTNK